MKPPTESLFTVHGQRQIGVDTRGNTTVSTMYGRQGVVHVILWVTGPFSRCVIKPVNDKRGNLTGTETPF